MEKHSDINMNTVADNEIPLQNQPGRNGIGQSATMPEKISLQSSLSEESSRQIGAQRYNDSNDKLHTLWAEGESAILQSLGMTKEQATDEAAMSEINAKLQGRLQIEGSTGGIGATEA